MAIKLPAVIYLDMRAQTPAKKKWLTFIQNTTLTGFLSLLLLLTYFMKLLLSLHSTSLAVKHSRCRIKLCCKDRGKKRSWKEMRCLASHSESSYMCMVSGALSQFCWELPFSFSEQHFNLIAALSPCSCIAASLLLHWACFHGVLLQHIYWWNWTLGGLNLTAGRWERVSLIPLPQNSHSAPCTERL